MPDDPNGVWIEPLGVRLRVQGGLIFCTTESGEAILDREEQRDIALERAAAAERARDAEKQRADAERAAREAAERAGAVERAAREAAELRLRELEAELAKLRGN